LAPIPRACEGRAEPVTSVRGATHIQVVSSATSVSKATRRRRLGGGWLPSPVRFSGMMRMMMLLLLRPAAARFSYRVVENRRH
jgi:hypothetical protein